MSPKNCSHSISRRFRSMIFSLRVSFNFGSVVSVEDLTMISGILPKYMQRWMIILCFCSIFSSTGSAAFRYPKNRLTALFPLYRYGFGMSASLTLSYSSSELSINFALSSVLYCFKASKILRTSLSYLSRLSCWLNIRLFKSLVVSFKASI